MNELIFYDVELKGRLKFSTISLKILLCDLKNLDVPIAVFLRTKEIYHTSYILNFCTFYFKLFVLKFLMY